MGETPSWTHANLRHNTAVHTVDAGFFGLALGFSSFIAVVPLFLSTVTSAPVLLGLAVVLHPLGWHLPQFLASRRIGNRERLLPLVLRLTLHERVPFFVLAAVAAMRDSIPPDLVLVFTYALVFWIGVGGGFTAPAFLTLVSKIVAPRRRGVFLGLKTSAANLGLAGGAFLAGIILTPPDTRWGFPIVFLAAGVATALSWAFLAQTREPTRAAAPSDVIPLSSLDLTALGIFRRDSNFRWFMAARWLSQIAMMALAFFAVYATGSLGLTTADVGLATAAFGVSQVAANPIMTAMGDRLGFRLVMAVGMVCASLASLAAAVAASPGSLVVVFTLAGLANVGAWTVPLAMSTQFGREGESAAYIGLGNTLVAPSILIAPLLGGLLAQVGSYAWTFATAAVAGVAAAIVLVLKVEDPWKVARDPDGILENP